MPADAESVTLFDDGSAELDALRAAYLRLVRVDLPTAARGGGWPVRLDHCFMRLVLDGLFGQPWPTVLTRRTPAYRQLTAGQLRRAIGLARALLAGGPPLARRMNAASLRSRAEAAAPTRNGPA